MSKKNRKKNRNKPKNKGKMYTGDLPQGMTIKLAANFGTEEPFVVRTWIQIKEILKYVDLPNNDEIDFRFDRVVEQLNIARVHLGRIEDENFSDNPSFDQQAEYASFYNSVWWAYKDRFKLFMKELGFDLGFIFQNDENFEKGTKIFLKAHPEATEFVAVARNDRQVWQNLLSSHRNAMHSGDRRNQQHDLDNLADARMIFNNIWQAIEENFVYLVEEVMSDSWAIVHIPENQRDQTIPVHFKPYPKRLLDGTIKLPPVKTSQSEPDNKDT